MQAKNTMPRKLGNKPQKAPFWEPKWLQKWTLEAWESALGASCARLARQELSKSALGEHLERHRKLKTKFGPNLSKKWLRRREGLRWVGGRGAARKSLPGG